MPYDQKGNSRLQLQVGAKVVEHDDGTLTGSARWEGGSENAGSAPSIGSKHPMNSRLECTSYELEALALGKIAYTASYFGITNSTRRVAYNVGVASEDIQTHPRFEIIAGTPENPQPGAKWIKRTDDLEEEYYEFLGFFNGKDGFANAKNSMVGTTHYLLPSGVVEISYYTSKQPSAKRLMTIQNTVKGWKKPEGVKDVLFTDAPYRQIGRSHYHVTETYLCSDEKGWNPKVYKKAS